MGKAESEIMGGEKTELGNIHKKKGKVKLVKLTGRAGKVKD